MNYDNELDLSTDEIAVKAGVYELPDGFKTIAIKAINDLRKEGYTGEGIDTAIHKKSVNQGVKQGTMGLLGNNKFQTNVYKQIERNKKSKNINVDEGLDCKEEIFDYLDSLEG